MKRPLIWITVGYITGIIWGLYLKISIVPIFLLFGGIFALLIKTEIININFIKEYKFFIISFVIFSIISNIQINYLEYKYNNLYKEIKLNETQEVEIIGTIISERKETTYKASYTVRVDEINKNKKFKKTNLIIYTSKDIYLKYGEQLCFKGTYEEAKGSTNYKAFDYKEYLKTKGVYGIVNVDGKIEILKVENLNLISLKINEIRNKIKSNLKDILGERAKITIGILLRRYFRNSRTNYTKF